MNELEQPYALLDLADGQSISFTPLGYLVGETTIYPPHAPGGKLVKVLRVRVDPKDKPAFPHYLDITSVKLYARLLPEVQRADVQRLRITITARGFPPKKDFEVTREVI